MLALADLARTLATMAINNAAVVACCPPQHRVIPQTVSEAFLAIVAPAGFSSQREREETYCSSPPQLSTQSIVVWMSEGVSRKRLLSTMGHALFYP